MSREVIGMFCQKSVTYEDFIRELKVSIYLFADPSFDLSRILKKGSTKKAVESVLCKQALFLSLSLLLYHLIKLKFTISAEKVVISLIISIMPNLFASTSPTLTWPPCLTDALLLCSFEIHATEINSRVPQFKSFPNCV